MKCFKNKWKIVFSLVLVNVLVITGTMFTPSNIIYAESEINDTETLWIDEADTSWYEQHKEESEYAISTPKQLAGLAKLLLPSTTNGKDYVDFEGKTIKLTSDIDLNGKIWTPIGGFAKNNNISNTPEFPYQGQNTAFKGVFDGNGHIITGMNAALTNHSGSLDMVGYGFFGYVSNAIIKNFTIKNSKIDLNLENYGYTANGIGLIVGTAESVELSNIDCIQNEIKVKSVGWSNISIGGFIGAEGNCVSYSKLTTGTQIKNCTDKNMIMDLMLSGNYNYNNVGGAIGSLGLYNSVKDEDAYHSSIEDTNVEDLTIKESSIDQKFKAILHNVGGVLGLNNSKSVLKNNRIDFTLDMTNMQFSDSTTIFITGGIVGYGIHNLSTGYSEISQSQVTSQIKMPLSMPTTFGGAVFGGIMGYCGAMNSPYHVRDNYSAIDFSDIQATSYTELGAVFGEWSIKEDKVSEVMYNVTNHTYSTSTITDKIAEAVNVYDSSNNRYSDISSYDLGVSKNWYVTTNDMIVMEKAIPIEYHQFAEKKNEEDFFNHMIVNYQGNEVRQDVVNQGQAMFLKKNDASVVNVNLSRATHEVYQHEFQESIRVEGKASISTGNLVGTVTGDNIIGTTVEVYNGNVLIATTTTDTDGNFHFQDLPYNIYSLVAKKDDIVVTESIHINAPSITKNVKLPTITLNTIVNNNNTEVSVDNLDRSFNEQDKQDATKSNTEIRIELNATLVDSNADIPQKIMETINNENYSLEQCIDFSIIKRKIVNDLEVETSNLKSLTNYITLYIPIPENLLQDKQQLVIYRHHKDEKGKITIEPLHYGDKADEESYMIIDNHIKIVANKFSTYAIIKNQTRLLVEYESNGGNVIQNVQILFGNKLQQPKDPIKEGYTFGGWYKDATLKEKWNFLKDEVRENMKLYARWTKIDIPQNPEVENPNTEKPIENLTPNQNKPSDVDISHQNNPSQENHSTNTSTNTNQNVKTSDSTSVTLYLWLSLASFHCLVILVVLQKIKEKRVKDNYS